MSATTLNRRRNRNEAFLEDEDVYDLDDPVAPIGGRAVLSRSSYTVLTSVQLGVLWLALWGPLGKSLIDAPLERLQVAILVLSAVRTVQCVLAPRCGSSLGGCLIRRKRTTSGLNQSTAQYPVWATTLGFTLAGAAVLHIVAVLFGAHLIDQFTLTLHGALFLSLLAITPAAMALGDQWSDWARIFGEHKLDYSLECTVYYPLVLTIVGAWIGSMVLPLDWDRPWQVWPIPSVLGGAGGYIAGLVVSLLITMIWP